MDHDVAQRFDDLDQRLDHRFEAIDRRFEAIDRRFETVDQRFDVIDQRFDAMDQRFDAMDQRFDAMEDRFENRFDEVKRHTGVLVEGLRHEVQLLAEGLAMHIEVHHVQDRTFLEQQFRETRTLFQLSHEQLSQRIDNLERRSQA
jgi:chromosome segregation ATPase